MAAKLEERQATIDDAELLPRVTLADVPEDLKYPVGQSRTIKDMPAVWYNTGTNGMVYQQLVTELPAFDAELTKVLPLYSMALSEVGSGGRDYMQTQAEQAAVLGGLGSRISTRGVLGDPSRLHAVMVLTSRGLNRNTDHITRFIEQAVESPDFSEVERIADLIAQARMRVQSSISGRGHSLASAAACAGMSMPGALSHHWSGLQAILDLQELDDAIKSDKAVLTDLSDKFRQIHERISKAPREWLIVSEEEQLAAIESAIGKSTLSANTGSIDPFTFPVTEASNQQAWSTNAQVNFCAQAHKAVSGGHADGAPLSVLGEYLSNGHLHSAVREKGGAYGGGAGFDGESGAFRFYSYRDPRLEETYADFDASIDWMLNDTHEERLLEESILSVIGRIDKPGSPAGEAVGNYYSERFGRGADYTRKVRKQILAVTVDDLKRVATTYLTGEKNRAVVGPSDKLEGLDGFEQFKV